MTATIAIMTGLKDLLRKREHIAKQAETEKPINLNVPEFTFIRTTTESEEIIQPPNFPGDEEVPNSHNKEKENSKKEHRRTLGFRKSSNAAITKDSTATRTSLESNDGKEKQALPVRPKNERKLSERLPVSYTHLTLPTKRIV